MKKTYINIKKDSYHPFKKPNSNLLYIHTESNHPPQIIKQIPIAINDRLSQNSSDEKIFNLARTEYGEALKRNGFKDFSFKYNPKIDTKVTPNRKRKRNIIWFNPPCNKNVLTNIGKTFLQLIDKYFPKPNPLHKLFIRNTTKVSYSCTSNIAKIIKNHNNKIISMNTTATLACNCKLSKQNLPYERQLQKNKCNL